MPYKKSAISSAQIVAAATRVIARKGYARTSLNDVAREAGMSKGAVHYHFPTKEALVSKVLESACDAVAERTRAAWERAGGDPFGALRSSVRELWDVRAARSDEFAVVADLLAQSLHDESLRPQLAAYYRFAAGQTTEHMVTTLAKLGLRPKVQPELVPRILLGLLDGLVLQVFVEPGVIDAEERLRAVELIATGLFEIPTSPGAP
ncbi:MAG: TetR/AcrR family transcriptional regulator [Sandaracinaceae bacterium]|nr:TetR/AcrR family transcriptional regulator [Sandaracinaceae bacterium]